MSISRLQLEKLAKQGLLLPGFCDAHLHLIEYGKSLEMVDLRRVSSISDMIEKLKTASAESGRVMAFGWNQEQFDEKRFPSRYDLDKIAQDRPVLLTRICAHVTVVNSYVIHALGLDKSIPTIRGGQIDTDDLGVATGVFRERARQLIYDAGFYDESSADIKRYILTAQRDLLAKGIVEVHVEDFRTFPNIAWREVVASYAELEISGQLKLKVVFQANTEEYEELKSTMDAMDSRLLSLSGIKLFTDGSLGARTAQLREPYHDDPSNCGIHVQSDEALHTQFTRIFQADLAIVVHAIGDRAIERVLEAFEMLNAERAYYQRCAIIHCQVTAPDLIERMAALGIAAYVQPIFIHEDAAIVEARLGTVRAAQAYAFQSMKRAGIKLRLSSDAPIDTPDVIKGLHCAVKRQTLHDEPLSYLVQEGLDLAEALADYQSKRQNCWVQLDMPIERAIDTPLQNHICAVYIEGENVLKGVDYHEIN